MAQPFRLGHAARIDRGKPISFSFNGRTIEGYVGDTPASALAAR